MWCFSPLSRATYTCCMHLQCRDVEIFVVRIQKQSQFYTLYFSLNKAPKLSGWPCSTLCGGCRKPSSTTPFPKRGMKTCTLTWLKLILFRSVRSSASQCTSRYVISTGEWNYTSISSLTIYFLLIFSWQQRILSQYVARNAPSLNPFNCKWCSLSEIFTTSYLGKCRKRQICIIQNLTFLGLLMT